MPPSLAVGEAVAETIPLVERVDEAYRGRRQRARSGGADP